MGYQLKKWSVGNFFLPPQLYRIRGPSIHLSNG